MTVAARFKAELTAAFRDAQKSALAMAEDSPPIERPRQRSHGDYACHSAMRLAARLKLPPREIAQKIISAFSPPKFVEEITIAGAGFINVKIKPSAKAEIVADALRLGDKFGAGEKKPSRIHLEFVSANPTGPLHIGHGRGAAYGASLAEILRFAGDDVHCEYYVNDCGRQTDILAASLWLRYLARWNSSLGELPKGAYQGDYLEKVAAALADSNGEEFVREVSPNEIPRMENADESADAMVALARKKLEVGGGGYAAVQQFALEKMLEDIRGDLKEFGVKFHRWFCESELADKIQPALDSISPYLYEKEGALWFRASEFGDEKDRVVRRQNGAFTYIAADIAYLRDKFSRHFDSLIYVLGADHHGYIPRLHAAATAMGYNAGRIESPIIQFAALKKGGGGEGRIQMSTRAGEFVSLRELREEIGNDAARYFFIARRADQHLEFDLELAKSKSADNPVYYIQYAHARICSVLSQWGGGTESLADIDENALNLGEEHSLIDELLRFEEAVENAGATRAPHILAHYLYELAVRFHGYYAAAPILKSDEPIKSARLALALAVKIAIKNGLALLGVNAPEKM